jgi:hypothetical protein
LAFYITIKKLKYKNKSGKILKQKNGKSST